MNFKIWLENSFQQLISIVKSKGFLLNPVFHRSSGLFNSFDLSKSSTSAIVGPAFYFSKDQGRWRMPGEENINRSFLVAGNIIDLTQPLSFNDTKILSDLIGRKVDSIPILSLERKFGSVSQGLKKAGYDGAWHLGPGNKIDLAMFNPKLIKLADVNTYDDQGNLIPIEKRFDVSVNDVRY